MNFFEIAECEDQVLSLVYRYDGEIVQIEPWGEDSFRVRSTFLGELKEEENGLIPERPLCGCTDIEIDDTEASMVNGKIQVRCKVADWGKMLQITFTNQKGEVLLQEISAGGALTLKAREYRVLPGGDFYLKQSFISNPKEKIFGMGQYQQEFLNLKGCNLELAHRNSQASVPFYVSSLGYGFLWNNPSVGEVHFGLNTTQWVARETAQNDYWITAGDSPKEIEEHYSEVTGRAPIMPEYGLGFWQCKLRYYNQEQVLSIAREYKRRQIPIDVIVIDYYHWKRCGDWKFDPEYFPNPRAMVEELDEMGIKLMVSIWPQVDVRSENYPEMQQLGLLVKSNTGVDVQMLFHGNNVFMDATNPRTREYVWKKIKENYYDDGIQVFWLDEAEPEFTGYSFDQYRFAAGPVLKVGNQYPRDYARLFYEGMQDAGQKEVVNLIRCAWVGSQRYGALVWSGDIFSSYEDFRRQICAGISMGLAGIPWWTTDIGGFHAGNIYDPDFKELLVRWFQYGTFCPVMRIHGARQPETPIINAEGEVREKTGAENEVWSFGEDIEKILVKYIRIRESLRPYTRRLMQEAHEKGEPILRALFYEFPEDPQSYEPTDEYLFGSEVLVAPICHQHEEEREVYLPKGAQWILASDGSVYEGGQSVHVKAGIETIPVFLRNADTLGLVGKI